jgi:protein TonB
MRLASGLLGCLALAACSSDPAPSPALAIAAPPAAVAPANTGEPGCPVKAAFPVTTQLPEAGFLPPPPSGSTVALPQHLRAGEPDYPSASRRCREEGKVAITYCVGADGRVENVQVVTSSGFARLDNSVLLWASRDRHTAGTINGKPSRYCGLHFEHEFAIDAAPAEHAGGTEFGR